MSVAPTKLFKCIPFSKPYWAYVAQEEKLRFATIPELWNGNDAEEFKHRWDTRSQFFLRYGSTLSPYYDELFSKTAVLSLGKTPNERCWKEYCSEGGVRYEFEYESLHQQTSEVNCGDVVYSDAKEFNLPRYLTGKEPDSGIRRLLLEESGLGWIDLFRLLLWIKSGRPNEYALNHIYEELTFKKVTQYAFEDEYRFVHLLGQIGPASLKLKLDSQKANLADIGLRLIGISTSDVKRVKEAIPKCNELVNEIYFS